MLFNPLFMQSASDFTVGTTEQTSAKASKLGNAKYLFADIIKVFNEVDQTGLNPLPVDTSTTTATQQLLPFQQMNITPGDFIKANDQSKHASGTDQLLTYIALYLKQDKEQLTQVTPDEVAPSLKNTNQATALLFQQENLAQLINALAQLNPTVSPREILQSLKEQGSATFDVTSGEKKFSISLLKIKSPAAEATTTTQSVSKLEFTSTTPKIVTIDELDRLIEEAKALVNPEQPKSVENKQSTYSEDSESTNSFSVNKNVEVTTNSYSTKLKAQNVVQTDTSLPLQKGNDQMFFTSGADATSVPTPKKQNPKESIIPEQTGSDTVKISVKQNSVESLSETLNPVAKNNTNSSDLQGKKASLNETAKNGLAEVKVEGNKFSNDASAEILTSLNIEKNSQKLPGTIPDNLQKGIESTEQAKASGLTSSKMQAADFPVENNTETTVIKMVIREIKQDEVEISSQSVSGSEKSPTKVLKNNAASTATEPESTSADLKNSTSTKNISPAEKALNLRANAFELLKGLSSTKEKLTTAYTFTSEKNVKELVNKTSLEEGIKNTSTNTKTGNNQPSVEPNTSELTVLPLKNNKPTSTSASENVDLNVTYTSDNNKVERAVSSEEKITVANDIELLKNLSFTNNKKVFPVKENGKQTSNATPDEIIPTTKKSFVDKNKTNTKKETLLQDTTPLVVEKKALQASTSSGQDASSDAVSNEASVKSETPVLAQVNKETLKQKAIENKEISRSKESNSKIEAEKKVGKETDTQRKDSNANNDEAKNENNYTPSNETVVSEKTTSSAGDNKGFESIHRTLASNQVSDAKNIIQRETTSFTKIQLPDVEKTIKAFELNKEVTKILESGSTQKVVLKLLPESLGKVKVTLEVGGDVIHAKAEVENESVKQMLQTNTETLKQSLTENGLQLASFNVSLAASGEKHQKANGQKKKPAAAQLKGKIEKSVNEDAVKSYGYNTYEYLA